MGGGGQHRGWGRGALASAVYMLKKGPGWAYIRVGLCSGGLLFGMV